MSDIHQFDPIWESWMIDEKIGQGSFGTVWKAHRDDPYSNIVQYSAVKHISIPRDENSDEDVVFADMDSARAYYHGTLMQLVKEIEAMIQLRGKPHIVSYEEHKIVPKEKGAGFDLFLRMELLTPLTAYVKQRHGMSRRETIKLGIDIASALEVLQQKFLVHRDIKPANIFVNSDGDFKLGDFGTARVLEQESYASTHTGTPNYMAPEVYSNSKNYDQTVDIYSLGIVLYRYVNNGFLPFTSLQDASSEQALMRRISGLEALPSPCPDDPALARVILRACAFRPGDRYQTATEMRRDLETLLNRGETDAWDQTIAVTTSVKLGQAPRHDPDAGAAGTVHSHEDGTVHTPARTEAPRPPRQEEPPIQAAPPAPGPQTPPAQAPQPPAVQDKPSDVHLVTPITPEPEKREQPKKKSRLPIVLAVLILAGIALGVFVIQGRSGKDGNAQPTASPEVAQDSRDGAVASPVISPDVTIGITSTATATVPPPATVTPTVTATVPPPATVTPTATATARPPATAAPAAANGTTTAGAGIPASMVELHTGDRVLFGHYEQDNNLNNGTEAIEWVVLGANVNGQSGSTMLISARVLDARAFDTSGKADWANSSLAQWLNGEFLNQAFTDAEQQAMMQPDRANSAGGSRVSLLSQDSARSLVQYLATEATPYAKARGASQGIYWLMTEADGQSASIAGAFTESGDGHIFNRSVIQSYIGVRPVILVRQDKLTLTSTSTCNLCGQEKKGNSKFCLDCGAWFCDTCGWANSRDTDVCAACGAAR